MYHFKNCFKGKTTYLNDNSWSKCKREVFVYYMKIDLKKIFKLIIRASMKIKKS